MEDQKYDNFPESYNHSSYCPERPFQCPESTESMRDRGVGARKIVVVLFVYFTSNFFFFFIWSTIHLSRKVSFPEITLNEKTSTDTVIVLHVYVNLQAHIPGRLICNVNTKFLWFRVQGHQILVKFFAMFCHLINLSSKKAKTWI